MKICLRFVSAMTGKPALIGDFRYVALAEESSIDAEKALNNTDNHVFPEGIIWNKTDGLKNSADPHTSQRRRWPTVCVGQVKSVIQSVRSLNDST